MVAWPGPSEEATGGLLQPPSCWCPPTAPPWPHQDWGWQQGPHCCCHSLLVSHKSTHTFTNSPFIKRSSVIPKCNVCFLPGQETDTNSFVSQCLPRSPPSCHLSLHPSQAWLLSVPPAHQACGLFGATALLVHPAWDTGLSLDVSLQGGFPWSGQRWEYCSINTI